ncbi:MAG: DUF6293 family protein [Nitrososphaerales archaeon]
MRIPLRVHICAVAFDIDRIIIPIQKMKADKVYLIQKRGEDRAKNFMDHIIKKLTKNN